MAKKKIAVIGIGKIAQDQHLPVIDKSPDFELAACISTRGLGHRDVPVFKTPAEFYKAMPEVKLVAICTPPGVRHAYVRQAIDAGMDVLLEKPREHGLVAVANDIELHFEVLDGDHGVRASAGATAPPE